MGMEFDLDLTHETHDTMDSGGRVQVGWYAARCSDCYDDTKSEDTTVLEFTVLRGAFAGQKLFYRLRDPRTADNDKDQKTRRNRVMMIAARLGLIGKEHAGKQVALNFVNAIGWEGVVHVTDQTWTKDDGTQGGGRGIDYSGIYPFGHHELAKKKDVPAEFRPAAAGQPSSSLFANAGAPAGASGGGGRGDIPLDDI